MFFKLSLSERLCCNTRNECGRAGSFFDCQRSTNFDDGEHLSCTVVYCNICGHLFGLGLAPETRVFVVPGDSDSLDRPEKPSSLLQPLRQQRLNQVLHPPSVAPSAARTAAPSAAPTAAPTALPSTAPSAATASSSAVPTAAIDSSNLLLAGDLIGAGGYVAQIYVGQDLCERVRQQKGRFTQKAIVSAPVSTTRVLVDVPVVV